MVTRAPVSSALARVEALLLDLPVIEAVLARREVSRPNSEDAENLIALVAELSAHQEADGSWGGDLGRTAESLLLLAELLPDVPVHDNAQRAVGWLRLQQDRPGSFASGCDAERHARAICEHALPGGFFSAAPAEVDLTGRTLGTGLRFLNDADARAGLSSLALRATLRWAEPSDSDQRHIASLTRLAAQAFRTGKAAVVGAAAYTQILGALTTAPRTAEVTASLHSALSRLAATQRADGSWTDIETFDVLELLMQAIKTGCSSPLFEAAILRTSELLAVSQNRNGAWGSGTDPYRLMVGWRALRHSLLLLND